MRILVVGSGGREHALVWKIAQSRLVDRVYCAPGNPGIGTLAERVNIQPEEIDRLLDFARRERVDLTVIGPEAPLVAGIVNRFQKAGLKCFGPTAEAAQLEASKVFAKNLFRKYNIPTASFRSFDSATHARAYLKECLYPVALKADGLAAGKGVILCENREQAEAAIQKMMVDQVFGAAGAKVVVEEFLTGEELSLIAITDSKTILVFETAQDHKRVYDGDKGPNTGGMGAYSPTPFMTREALYRIEKDILVPLVHALKKEKRTFTGVLYAGLMITHSGPKVLEFNARFGDPECQPLMMRLKSDLVPILLGAVDGNLDAAELEWDDRTSVCVVMASGGYPGEIQKDFRIDGLDRAVGLPDLQVFHGATASAAEGVVTSGGRVLGVTALGSDFNEARARAYQAVSLIRFQNMHYRLDIGTRALRYLELQEKSATPGAGA